MFFTRSLYRNNPRFGCRSCLKNETENKARKEETAAALCYLPSYSPDLNPIEKCWAQVKKLRRLKTRSVTALQEAIPEALSTISPQNAVNYFRHCGYPL